MQRREGREHITCVRSGWALKKGIYVYEHNVNIVHDDFPHAIEYLLCIYLLYVYLVGMVMEWVWKEGWQGRDILEM